MVEDGREPLVGFADELRRLKLLCGAPSHVQLEELTAATGTRLPRSTINDKLNAKSLPDWDFVMAYVMACGMHAAEAGIDLPAHETDVDRWDRLHLQMLMALDRAWERSRLTAAAQQQLARRADGRTLADEHSERTSSRVVPRQLLASTRHFAGREDETSTLVRMADEATSSGGTVVISAIDGTAGIGKTALALHVGHMVAAQFPDGALYVNLRGFDPAGIPLPPADALRGFLDALDVPPERIPDGLDAQAALYRSLLAGKRILVVLDNAATVEQVRPLLPGSAESLVLITSRNTLSALVVREGAHPLTLDLLTDDEALDLLRRRVGHARVAAESRDVSEVVVLCARLPLALAIVAARAAMQPDLSFRTLARELRETPNRLGALESGDADTNLRSVFSWSYDRLTTEAARLFRLLGLHPGPDIEPHAIASLSGVPLASVGPLIDELVRAHLLEERSPERHSFHDLLREYAKELVTAVETVSTRQAAVRRVLDHYLHTAHAGAMQLFPLVGEISIDEPAAGVVPQPLTSYSEAWDWFENEHAVLLSVIDLAITVGSDTYAWQVPWTLQDYFRRRGHWHDWAATQSLALSAAQRQRNEFGAAHAHHGLGRAFTWLGRQAAATEHFDEALRLFEALGNKAGQADAHLDLAQMFSSVNQPRDALPHAERGLELAIETGALRLQAKALNNAGWYHAQLGDGGEALSRCLQALELFRQIDDLRGQSNTLDSVGYAYFLLGDDDSAKLRH